MAIHNSAAATPHVHAPRTHFRPSGAYDFVRSMFKDKNADWNENLLLSSSTLFLYSTALSSSRNGLALSMQYTTPPIAKLGAATQTMTALL